MRVLVVEDEHRIAQAIKQGLVQEGYAVDLTFDGADGLASAEASDYDVIVMDVMMPELSGIEVTRQLRKQGNHTPILLLTAKSQTRDIVTGLDAGADDYLAKPFSFDVLVARLRALLRRPDEVLDSVLTVDDLELDLTKRTATRAGQDLRLSSKEYAILEYLLRNKGRIISKNTIISHVWDFDADVLPNNVEVFITYLRGKIEKPFPQKRSIIETIRGFGYVIKDSGT